MLPVFWVDGWRVWQEAGQFIDFQVRDTESNTGTALFSENMAFRSSQTDLVTILFILTEVIDVNSLFGVITYKRIAENKHICYWICSQCEN